MIIKFLKKSWKDLKNSRLVYKQDIKEINKEIKTTAIPTKVSQITEESIDSRNELRKNLPPLPKASQKMAKKLANSLTKKSPEELKKYAEIREKATKVSIPELRGGHKWLEVKEKNYEKKYSKLKEAYLDDLGDGSYKVKSELDDNETVKMNLGAGDILPPSVTMAAITDLKGNTRIGKRMLVGKRVGYYDQDGYIPIYGNYIIKPTESINKNSNEYKDAIKSEIRNYKKQKTKQEERKRIYNTNKISNGPRASGEIMNGNELETLKKKLLEFAIPNDKILKEYSENGYKKLQEIRKLHNEFYGNKGFSNKEKKKTYMARHNKLSRELRKIIKNEIPINIRKEEIKKQIDYAKKVSKEFKFPPALLLAIIATESSYNPLSTHKTTASTAAGLFQFLNSTWMGKHSDGNGGYIGFIKKKNIWHEEWGEKNYSLSGRLNTYMMLHATARYIRGSIDTINKDKRITLNLNNIEESAELIYLAHNRGKGSAVPVMLAIKELQNKGHKNWKQMFQYYKTNPREFDNIMRKYIGHIPKIYDLLYNNSRCKGSRDCSVEKFLGVYFKHAKNVARAATKLHKESELDKEENEQRTMSNISISEDNKERFLNGNETRFFRYFERELKDKNGKTFKTGRSGFPGQTTGKFDTFTQKRLEKQLDYYIENNDIEFMISLASSDNPNFNTLKQIINTKYPQIKFISNLKISGSNHKKNIKTFEFIGNLIKQSKNFNTNCNNNAHRAATALAGGFLASGLCKTFQDALDFAGLNNKQLQKLNDNDIARNYYISLLKYAQSKNIPIYNDHSDIVKYKTVKNPIARI